MIPSQFIPGATAVGITFKDGIILGAEKRISYGTYVVSRAGKKVFKISDLVGAACAGMVVDMQVLVREISALVKIRELELRRPIPPNSVAKLMSAILFARRYYPLITQVIIGGVDEKPSIYVLDPLGSVIPDEYSCVGSGAEIAIGVIEANYSSDLSEESAKELVVKSIKSAIQRDSASGDGTDLLVITKTGSKEESIKF
ncbi:MAG: proteasome subunit beta [Candidatus Methylarchaceae archaeon HK02M2]|nr:proteasome subunit beta [Candidatus Methylarchaceae archaeon HK02M2]